MKNGEKYAKHAVTGDQLQAWALKLLADPQNEQLKTNYPGKLRQMVSDRQMYVEIITNSSPHYVSIFWGGVDWQAGFNVGSTNFVDGGHKWQDGVYFFFNH